MLTSSYPRISLPVSGKFAEMSSADIKRYSIWFHEIAPERIKVLSTALRMTDGFKDWTPVFTAESLDELGEWMAQAVSVRSRTNEEISEIYRNAPEWFKHVSVPELELTDETLSIAMDVGFYVGEMLVRRHPWLKWRVPSNKREADYGQPVLTGFGGPICNPVRITVNLSYSFADRTQQGSRLRELYETWSRMARASRGD